LIVFLLATLGLARKGVFLALGTLLIAAAFRYASRRGAAPRFPPLPRLWKRFFVAAFGAFTVYYLVTAMQPEYSPDGVAYHLHFVNQYNLAHGFVRISNFLSNLSQGIELLFLFAFAFGRHSSAALVHLAFLIVLALSILSYARRAGYPTAGVCAALLVYTCPIMGKDGTDGVVDVAVAAILFAVFYLVRNLRRPTEDRPTVSDRPRGGLRLRSQVDGFSGRPVCGRGGSVAQPLLEIGCDRGALQPDPDYSLGGQEHVLDGQPVLTVFQSRL